MADLWADRIKLYPKLEIQTSVPGTASGGNGVTGADPGMSTETLSPSTMGKSRPAPANPPGTWSSGPDNNDYLAKD